MSLFLNAAFLLIAFFSFGSFVLAQDEVRDKKAIAKIKNISSRRLDRKLPIKTFSSWLAKNVGSRKTTEWELHDCGEQDGSGRQVDFPICVGTTVRTTDRIVVNIYIAVGTHKHGVFGKPVVWGIWIETIDGRKFEFNELSEISQQLRKLREINVKNN